MKKNHKQPKFIVSVAAAFIITKKEAKFHAVERKV